MLRPFATSPDSPIRVFLVDDSPLALVVLKRMLATSPDIEVVGTARGGREALEQFERARPEVVCTDYLMPDMDGLALIEAVMERFPRPILVISSTVDPAQRQKAFPLLAAGAVDVVAKPGSNDSFEEFAAELVRKIKLVCGVAVISRRAPNSAALNPAVTGAVADGSVAVRPTIAASGGNAIGGGAVVSRSTLSVSSDSAVSSGAAVARPTLSVSTRSAGANAQGSSHGAGTIPFNGSLLPARGGMIRIVAVGASTGGPQVLQTLFASLPANFPCPILCVQHISPGFLGGLVEWLHAGCRVRVKIAENGEQALPGTVYLPPENTHLEVTKQGQLMTSQAPPVDGHKPSVTATFEAVARAYGPAAVGILLTGMGNDGAAGLEAIARAGGTTFAQDEASCVVFGMPKQAISRGAAGFVLPPEKIVRALLRLTIPA